MGIMATTTTAAILAGRAMHTTITPMVTTAFTPVATCLDNQLTMLENEGFEIWLNYPLPVPHTTVSACYPDQFIDSIVASAAGTTEAAFSPLVCPKGYTTAPTSWPAASNYIACCPSSWGLATDDSAPSTRPALNAKCYTNLPSGSTLQMTVYGKSSISNTNAFSVSASTMQAYAFPYEGYAGKDVSHITVSTTTSSSSVSSSTSTAGATHTITAADSFSPNTTTAATGDTVIFKFASGNHSLTEATFDAPCKPLAGGVSSGFRPNFDNQDPAPLYAFQVDTTDPQWFYSEGTGDCASGMAFGLNPNSDETFTEFRKGAIAEGEAEASEAAKNKSSGGTPKAVKIGVSVGVVVFALLVAAALGAFIMYRRRKAASESPYDAQDYYAADYKHNQAAEMNVLPPAKQYELPTAATEEANLSSRHELASPMAELPASRFSENVHDTSNH